MINSIRNTLIWAFTVIVMVVGFAVISASHAQVAPLSPKRALELTASAAHGYPLHDGQARLYLFADDQCSVCSPALWQATKLPVPVKLVPIKVYVPERDSDPLRASILAANTEIFYAIGRPFMPLWVGLNACDKPIIMLGELDEHDIQQLKDRDRAGCIDDQPARDTPRTGMSVPFPI